jgi:formylmethanofuran dehydrogenase subunit E
MHNNAGCRYTNIDRECSIEELAAFHGHLGPYIVLGYRIGRHIREHFCDDPFRVTARIYCPGTPPESCLADGVQLGSGCTLGKRNIEIVISPELRCEFSADGKSVRVVPKSFDRPDRNENYARRIEQIAEEMYGRDDRDLFDVDSC